MRDDVEGVAPHVVATWLSSVLGQYLWLGTFGLVALPGLAMLVGALGAAIDRGAGTATD